MTPAATPPDPRTRRLPAGLTLCAALAAVLAGGCGKPPAPVTEENTGPAAKGDPWKVAAARLKKDTDFLAVKSALSTLGSELGTQGGEKLPALSAGAVDQLAAVVPLSPEDREEVGEDHFSGHDPAYLADCFYMRDAARSLNLSGLPPERQAELAFEWVCRQVYLQPWLLRGSEFVPAVPPTAVLRRGFGTGLERGYVFLALLQQLEIDACLVGGPEPGGTFAGQGPKVTYPSLPQAKIPRGPFWAVGARAGNDVKLFDPWRGVAFPATLGTLKANPEAHKAWFEDKANLSGVTPDDAKKATAYLAVPVSSLSARMNAFESHLKGELGVKVAYDLKALQARQSALGEPKAAYWNPKDDPFAYGRVSRNFLPADMGGRDRSEPGARLYDEYLRSQLRFPLPENIDPESELGKGLIQRAAGALFASFITPPNPRERIQRGQFEAAARDLVAKQEAFAHGLERLRTQDSALQAKQLEDWRESMKEQYRELGRARLPGNEDREAQARATEEIGKLWRQPAAILLVDRASAEVGRAEASYLLALCKHEQAERLQAKYEGAAVAEKEKRKPDVTDAWRTALGAWRTYEQIVSAHAAFPGRAEHARELMTRSAKLAEQDANK